MVSVAAPDFCKLEQSTGSRSIISIKRASPGRLQLQRRTRAHIEMATRAPAAAAVTASVGTVAAVTETPKRHRRGTFDCCNFLRALVDDCTVSAAAHSDRFESLQRPLMI